MQERKAKATRTEAREAPRAVLDAAHTGDIKGALGTLRVGTERPRSLRQRLLAMAAIVGPGIIVMVGDNDAGGVATYSQAGQTYGTSLLWVLLLLIPVLIVNQEMVVRLGAVTGMGHGKMIFERFGKFWGAFSVGDLFLLNFLTLVTEFIGVSLAMGYFGITPYISVPLTALLLVGVTASGSFARWERAMLIFIVANFLVIPLAILSHPHLGTVARDFVIPGVRGGLSNNSVFLIIAIVGTTVAPWQLFFQQSNIVDKRITPRWITYERVDTVVGSFVTVLGAGALMVTCAYAFGHASGPVPFTDAQGVARGLMRYLGGAAGAMYAVVLLNASLIGAAALSIATSYAVGDTFGVRHSLHWTFGEARAFYLTFTGIVLCAALIVLIPGAPLGLITTAVQAMAGVLLPSASVFLLLLCNDKAVLGPWVNRLWVNALAAVIISALLMLSAILTVTTIFPGVNVTALLVGLSSFFAVCLVAGGAVVLVQGRRRDRARGSQVSRQHRETWTMPPSALLERPPESALRTIALWAMWIYLAFSVVMLLVKAIQIATGHG